MLFNFYYLHSLPCICPYQTHTHPVTNQVGKTVVFIYRGCDTPCGIYVCLYIDIGYIDKGASTATCMGTYKETWSESSLG